ncbi:MAG: stage II sporulation protein P [Firmicutes bacterium]|nr:stage II sporulation protein P [Bacillota bacterium]
MLKRTRSIRWLIRQVDRFDNLQVRNLFPHRRWVAYVALVLTILILVALPTFMQLHSPIPIAQRLLGDTSVAAFPDAPKPVPQVTEKAQTPDPLPPQQPHDESKRAEPAQVAIYHTHNREAYQPDAGADQADRDNVLDVGFALAKALRQQGISTIHDTSNHLRPMAYAQAYRYSQVTAKTLLAQNKGLKLLIDLHRDGAPRSSTTVQVGGQQVAGVLLVIGAKNPGEADNLAVAEQLQRICDERFPGLCRGIRTASWATYNQEITPDALLIEIGGQQNTLYEAKRAAQMFAEVIATYLHQTGPGATL